MGVLTGVVLVAVAAWVAYAIVSGFVDVVHQTDEAIDEALRQR
jgi:hypothetical protein